MSGFIDGPASNLTTPFLMSNVVSYPLSDKPGNGNTKVFALTYCVQQANFAYANIGDNDGNAPGANFFEESPIKKIGAGVIEYTRFFAQLPTQYYEIDQVVYNFPGASSGTGFTYQRYGARRPCVVSKVATVNHWFAISANVPTSLVQQVTLITANGQPCDWIGQLSGIDNTSTNPGGDPSTWILSSQPQRWHGNIWEIITKTVTGPATFP